MNTALGRAASVAAVVACLATAAPAFAADASVAIGGFKYDPKIATINQGDMVTWNWVGPGVNHDVYEGIPPNPVVEPFPPALFESHAGIATGDITGPPPGGATWSHTFAAAGTYNYWCRRHPGMTASVVVNPVDPPAVTPSAEPVSPLAAAKAVCVSKRSFKIRIRQPRGERITAASVTVNGRPVAATAEGTRFTAPVDLRGFATGTYEVQITARTADGDTLRGTRRYRTCAAKLSSAGLPRL